MEGRTEQAARGGGQARKSRYVVTKHWPLFKKGGRQGMGREGFWGEKIDETFLIDEKSINDVTSSFLRHKRFLRCND